MGGMGQTDRVTRVMAHHHLLRQREGQLGNETVTGTYHHDRRYRSIMRMDGMAGQITRTVTGAVLETGRLEVVVVGVLESLLLLIPTFRATTGTAAAADANRRGMTDGDMIGMIDTMTGTGDGLIMTTGLGIAGRGAGAGHRLFATGIGIGITAGERPAATNRLIPTIGHTTDDWSLSNPASRLDLNGPGAILIPTSQPITGTAETEEEIRQRVSLQSLTSGQQD
jgi:hypothetical protein